MSLLGAGVWLVAVVWQVIALGGGPTDLSLVATGASMGLVGAVLIGGVAADRIPQKRILVAVEAVKAVAIGTAAVLAFTGSVEIWHLAVVAFVLGACRRLLLSGVLRVAAVRAARRRAAGGERDRGHAAADRDAGGGPGAVQRGHRRRVAGRRPWPSWRWLSCSR